jgi:hypothetical protein
MNFNFTSISVQQKCLGYGYHDIVQMNNSTQNLFFCVCYLEAHRKILNLTRVMLQSCKHLLKAIFLYGRFLIISFNDLFKTV